MDINSQNRMEETPAPSWRKMLEELKHPAAVIERGGTVQYANQAFQDLTQAGEYEIRLDAGHAFYPEYRKRVAASYNAAFNGIVKHCFAVMSMSEGRTLPMEIYLFPMWQRGSVSSILAIFAVVDERLLSFDRSSLSLITEENLRYDNIHFEFSPFPVIRIANDMRIIKCSRSFEGYIGLCYSDRAEDNPFSFDTLFSSDADRVRKAVTAIFSGESTCQRLGEVRLLTHAGETRIMNLTLYPLLDDRGVQAVEIVMEDITRITELKREINVANRALLFSDIMRGMLHTLSNTLNVILSKTQMVSQITEKESVSEGIHVIEDAASEVARQIKRVQKFVGGTREEAETTEPLVDIIEDAIEFAGMQFKVFDVEQSKRIAVDKRYFTSTLICSNTRLLREIITSLILKVSAAIARAGTITVTLRRNNDLQLLVETEKDSNSAPVAADDAQFLNIFSGIDIRQVADHLKIKIIEEESPTSYTIKAIFPQRMCADTQREKEPAASVRLRDLNILIVEDEKPLQKILNDMFDKMGNRVTVCGDGKTALEEFKRHPSDILITDYGIPGITGIELAVKIKEMNEKTLTVLLSGWALDGIKSYGNVVDLFLPKPFKLDDLLTQIARKMENRNT